MFDQRITLPNDEAHECLQPVAPCGPLDDPFALRLNLFLAPHLTTWHRLRQSWFWFRHGFAACQPITAVTPPSGILNNISRPPPQALFARVFLTQIRL